MSRLSTRNAGLPGAVSGEIESKEERVGLARVTHGREQPLCGITSASTNGHGEALDRRLAPRLSEFLSNERIASG
jgi:hypothetical protein